MQNSVLQWLSVKLLERPLQPRELLTARKVVYIVLIIVLFTASFFWRRAQVDARAVQLAIRQDSRGDVELSGELIRLSLTGSRGLVTCILWNQALEKQKKNEWSELELIVRNLTKLQPYFIRPWLFQSWNLSYNVSVESDRINDKYFFITRGIDLLAEGERQNHYHPDLRYSIGFYTEHKIMKSDQTNVLRSLFQLSMIPPSERDPDRFRKRGADGRDEIDWTEFEKFVAKHPQLARRLHSGQLRDTVREHKNQFTCRDAEDAILFLSDNWRVPGVYEPPEKRVGVAVEQKDVLLPPESRFPPIPPPRPNPYKPAGDAFSELTSDSTLDDTVDGYAMARAWYGYAQEPLPPADSLPGSNKPIADRVRQRRPVHMTTLLFRNYPALAQSFAAERLQQEGWFRPDAEEEKKAVAENRTAEEFWEFPEDSWFKSRGNVFVDPKTGKKERARLVLQKSQHADVVWDIAYRVWTRTGEANHLLFESPEAQAQTYQDALVYCKAAGVVVGSQLPPPSEGEDALTGDRKRRYEAAKYMFEYKFYRDLSNFAHHHNRAKIELEKTTIAVRKLFFEAETAYLRGDLVKARATYEAKPGANAAGLIAGGGDALAIRAAYANSGAIAVWRDEVLLGCIRDANGRLIPKPGVNAAEHRRFREHHTAQEYAYETQLRYLQFFNEQYGTQIKKGLSRTWEFTIIPASPPPAGSGLGFLLSYLTPSLIESQWTPPPIGTAYAELKGPLDILVFDVTERVPQDTKDQQSFGFWLIGVAGESRSAGPLLTTTTAGAWCRPLISESTKQLVRQRKGLNPSKKQPEADGEKKKR